MVHGRGGKNRGCRSRLQCEGQGINLSKKKKQCQTISVVKHGEKAARRHRSTQRKGGVEVAKKENRVKPKGSFTWGKKKKTLTPP